MPNRAHTTHTESASTALPTDRSDGNQRIAAAAIVFFTHFSQQFVKAVELQMRLLTLMGQAQGDMLHAFATNARASGARHAAHAGPFGVERRKTSVVINFPDRRARPPETVPISAT